MTYPEKLKDPRWQKKRLKILERDNWTCVACLRTDRTLHVHHMIYKGNPWDCEDKFLFTLCFACHKFEEDMAASNPYIKELAVKVNLPCVCVFDRMVIGCYLYGHDKKAYAKIESVLRGRGKDVNWDVEWH